MFHFAMAMQSLQEAQHEFSSSLSTMWKMKQMKKVRVFVMSSLVPLDWSSMGWFVIVARATSIVYQKFEMLSVFGKIKGIATVVYVVLS